MSGPIQTIPQGLLGLLQLKQLGNNPANLADSVAGVIDIRDHYFQRLAGSEVTLGVTASATVSARGQIGFATPVPSSQSWYVLNMTISALLLAAEYIRAAPTMFPTGSGPGSQIQVGPDVNDVVTARTRAWSAFASGPFWLPPGAQLGFTVYDIITAGNITVSLGLRAVVVPI